VTDKVKKMFLERIPRMRKKDVHATGAHILIIPQQDKNTRFSLFFGLNLG
jgi:hypothetical protein